MSRLVVAAINEYYTQRGVADHYFMLANDPSLDDRGEFIRLSEKHMRLAEISYDYILTNFKMDLDEASSSIKEHLAKDFTLEQSH